MSTTRNHARSLSGAGALLIGLLTAGSPAASPLPGSSGASPDGSTRFVLTAVTIHGVTAYPQRAFAPLYDRDLAREVALSDLVAIATAITDKYRRDGYFLTRAVVPPQAGEAGAVQLRVYEGYVGEVRVTGPAAPAVARLLKDLEGRRPLRLAELDRRLALASDLPGVRLTNRLEPDLDDPARHRLVVETQLRPVSASLYVDNRGAEMSGPWQAYGRAALNSGLAPGDQLALSVLTVPEDPREFTQVEATYALPLPSGGRVRGAVAASQARDSGAASNTWLGNESRSGSLRVSTPLRRGRDHALWLTAGMDLRHVEQNWLAFGRFKENLSVVRASLHGDRTGPAGISTGLAQVSVGVDAFGASDTATWRQSRWDADGQFFKLALQGSHYRDLGDKAGIYIAADAQWSSDALLTSEEFAVGALPYGRAYNYGEISGDHGVAGLVELRVGWAVRQKPLTFFQTYGFLDGAKTWNRRTPAGWRSAALSSAGGGVRLRFTDRLTLRLEAAKPLTRTPYTQGDKDWRAFASLTAGF